MDKLAAHLPGFQGSLRQSDIVEHAGSSSHYSAQVVYMIHVQAWYKIIQKDLMNVRMNFKIQTASLPQRGAYQSQKRKEKK